MTANQVALIKAREEARANRAKEELTRRGQNLGVVESSISALGRAVPKMMPVRKFSSKGGKY